MFESVKREAVVAKPLFPLPLVVFPGGRLPLQIFEARYLDMVGECMRNGTHFIVTMSRSEGFADVGCEVSIRDFDQLSNGLLGILAIGESKQQLFNPRQREDGLWLADSAPLPLEPSVALPQDHIALVELLNGLRQHPAVEGMVGDVDYTDAAEVGARLTELLPIDIERKQELFELSDPIKRLEELENDVIALQSQGRS